MGERRSYGWAGTGDGWKDGTPIGWDGDGRKDEDGRREKRKGGGIV